ncbi:MAG: DUF5703 domain-containing protein [Verrucomicrobia bacterium]|nr:DUF5703 domain-containing protein [Verrucomicrobiota bacterium]
MTHSPKFTALAVLLATSSPLAHAGPQPTNETPAWLAPYNIVWTEPGTKALHSMPLGGGNIALNVWTTKDDLLFYIASPDSWNGQTQVKMGRVRVHFSPNPFVGEFRQELDLATDTVHVRGKADDGTTVNLRVWVDAFQPIVRVEGTASKPVDATASIELIGPAEARFDGDSAVWHFRMDGPSPQRAQEIVKNTIEAIAVAVPDPMRNHTWGGRLTGVGLVADNSGEVTHEGLKGPFLRIKTRQPVSRIDLQATLRISQDVTLGAWEQATAELERDTMTTSQRKRLATEAWWRQFWDRSHIVVNPGKNADDPAWEAGRNYQLFRAMLAANHSGHMPTLFNGGPFLFEANPNERQWGHAGFMAQNQRLVYWPMLKSGDSDLLKVGLDFYTGRHQLATAWAKHFWNIEGAVFTEDINLFGLPSYGADASGHTTPACLRYHYVSGIEFALMMLQSGSYFGSDLRHYLPVADGMLRFFDQFYRNKCKDATGQELDKDGRLVIFPGNALEFLSGTTNDAPTVAGLIALSDALLALPGGLGTVGQRAFWKAFRDRLPPIPVRALKGRKSLAPADAWQGQRPDVNMELPHLYPVFPFRLYGVGLPDLDVARNAWYDGDTCPAKQKNHFCWYQGGIFAAGLGLTEVAREYALAKFLHPRLPDPVEHNGWQTQRSMTPWELCWTRKDWELPRYPAFWDGMIWDGRPDMDHGGAAMVQLQDMLLQTPGDQLVLFPAWPKDWDVDFKLHAPRQTVVEGVLRDGKLLSLKITPESRRRNLVNWLDHTPPPPEPVLLSARKPIVASSNYAQPGYDAAKANDNDLMTRWASAGDAREGTLAVDLGEEREIGSVWLAEIDYALTRAFAIEVRQDSDWKEVARGTTIGTDRMVKFPPIKGRHVRLHVLKADGPINLNEFQVFQPAK